jgi:hypothetical protein
MTRGGSPAGHLFRAEREASAMTSDGSVNLHLGDQQTR